MSDGMELVNQRKPHRRGPNVRVDAVCSMHECIILLLLLVSTHTRPQTYNISILIFYVFALAFRLVVSTGYCVLCSKQQEGD